jgi:hypothetical protein
VLIDSPRPPVTPLPVLKRGPLDQGVIVQPNVTPPYPTLDDLQLAVQAPNPANPPIATAQPTARLATGSLPGDIVQLTGHNLDGTVQVQLTSRWVTTPYTLSPLPGASSTNVSFQLPNDQTNLPAGIYNVQLAVTSSGTTRNTNVLSFPIGPRILTIVPQNPAAVDGSGNVAFAVTVSPQVWGDQQAQLLVDDQAVRADPLTTKTPSLNFQVIAPVHGTHFLRVRIDGVDSWIVQDYTAATLVFDPAQQVNITP